MKSVLITGGATGIGRAMGAAFAESGYRVWVTDVDRTGLKTLPEGWRGTGVNVADGPAMADLFAEVQAAWGGLDAVCANVGTAGPTAPVEDVTLEEWRTCLSVNLDGAFLTTKHAARMLKQSGQGAIILTTSTAGQHGYPNRSPYASAKWGVIGLMKTLAMELGPYGIRANAIAPGAVEGARMEGVLQREASAKGVTRDQIYAGYAAGTAMRSFVEAHDIAEMAVFLASDAARLVSGQVIAVDGHTFNPDPQT